MPHTAFFRLAVPLLLLALKNLEGVDDVGDVAGEPDGDSGGGAGDNPLLIGGIAAGAVVVAAVLVALYRSRAKKKQRKP